MQLFEELINFNCQGLLQSLYHENQYINSASNLYNLKTALFSHILERKRLFVAIQINLFYLLE